MSAGHVIVWSFRARPGREADFEREYGPGGAWARLFSRCEGWLGTELLRSRDRSYLVVDRFASRATYERFRAENAAAYAALDRACEDLTSSEAPLGEFERVG